MSALGVSVAHSGTVMSIMVDPTDEALGRKIEALGKSILALGYSNIRRLRTHSAETRRKVA